PVISGTLTCGQPVCTVWNAGRPDALRSATTSPKPNAAPSRAPRPARHHPGLFSAAAKSYLRRGSLIIRHPLPVVLVVCGVVVVVPSTDWSWLDVPVEALFGLPGSGFSWGCFFSQVSNSFGGTTFTSARIVAWPKPQSS